MHSVPFEWRQKSIPWCPSRQKKLRDKPASLTHREIFSKSY